MAAGAVWGFIPGVLKAFSGAHEVVTTIMLNSIAAALIGVARSSGRSWRPGFSFGRSPATSATAPCRSSSGDNGHLGILLAVAAVPVVWWLLFRTHARVRDPDRRREPGRGPLRRDAAAVPDHARR